MMMIVPLLTLALPIHADTFSDLKARLKTLNGLDPLKASVDHQIWNKNGDPKKPVITQGKVNAWVEEGPQGLKVFWSKELLQKVKQEARARVTDPEKTTPTSNAMAALGATRLHELFNPGEQLLEDLEQAKFVEERADALDGKPARCLTFKLEPKLAERERKYVKELDASLKVWLDNEGWPIGSEQQLKVKGRAFVVVSFQQEQREEFRYARVGRRLVTVRSIEENSGSGGGESGQSRNVTTLQY